MVTSHILSSFCFSLFILIYFPQPFLGRYFQARSFVFTPFHVISFFLEYISKPVPLMFYTLCTTSTKALPFVVALPRCPRRLCLSFWHFQGVYEGSAFRSWPFHGVHEGSAFQGRLSILLVVSFRCAILFRSSNCFFENEHFLRIRSRSLKLLLSVTSFLQLHLHACCMKAL